MLFRATIVAAFATLTACSTSSQQGDIYTASEIALIRESMQQQTLQVDCPTGCSISYKDPRDTLQLPKRTNGNDAIIAVAGSVERLVGAAIVPAALVYQGTKIAGDAIDALGSRQDTTIITNTSSVGDYSGDGSGASTGNSVGNTIGNSTGNSTGNSSVGDYSGASSGTSVSNTNSNNTTSSQGGLQ